MDAGYDDIDFISDITSEELQDIGINKKGRTHYNNNDIYLTTQHSKLLLQYVSL